LEFYKIGVENVSFPMLIPYKSIQKEKDHIEGFAPEFYYASKNLSDIDNLAVIRPTSEVLFNEYFSKKIESYKNLPIIYNQ
jgi:prolyl-tRNA synthetase